MTIVRTVSAIGLAAGWMVPTLAQHLDRPSDPIVVSGALLSEFAGSAVDRIVAFRYASGWVQIPLQVDERKRVDYGEVYGLGSVGLETIAYVDALTYTGPDHDPAFDADDELVFMAREAGQPAPRNVPPPRGTLAGTGTEVEISDPLNSRTAFVYLFRSDGSLSQDAGRDAVDYVFVLLAGSYLEKYNTLDGPNPEDSTAWSAAYRSHFSDRWVHDEMNVFAGGASGVDILDRHKAMFAPGDCSRTEDTFSDGQGAFFANKDGAVRCIRSYMGANSGPLTQRDHFFYHQRQDIITYLRVHPIPSIMDVFDYTPAATGMRYFNNLNTGGVVVDGVPDSVRPGSTRWEMVTGSQGTLILAGWIETNIPFFSRTSYYSDNSTPSIRQCTGDAYEYATSGIYVDRLIPNTDPLLGGAYDLVGLRIIYYEPPHQTPETAALRERQARTPLRLTLRRYLECPTDLNGDGRIDQADLATLLAAYGASDDGDTDGDGDTDLADLALLLAWFGRTCP